MDKAGAFDQDHGGDLDKEGGIDCGQQLAGDLAHYIGQVLGEDLERKPPGQGQHYSHDQQGIQCWQQVACQPGVRAGQFCRLCRQVEFGSGLLRYKQQEEQLHAADTPVIQHPGSPLFLSRISAVPWPRGGCPPGYPLGGARL